MMVYMNKTVITAPSFAQPNGIPAEHVLSIPFDRSGQFITGTLFQTPTALYRAYSKGFKRVTEYGTWKLLASESRWAVITKQESR